MTYENLLVADAGPVRTVTLNRPKALNALNRQTLAELAAMLADTAKTPSVRVLVLTGAGEKSFVAGADITEMKDATALEGAAMSKMGHDVLFAIQALSIPVIAAVNGFALGGGLELALACDFIVASDNARLGLVETNLGLIPGFGGVARLQRRVGPGHASEMIFSAAQLDSAEALRIGLVNKVVPQAELMPTVNKIADAIAQKGPYAIALAKRLLVEGSDADARTAHAMEQVSFGLVFASADKQEGVGAFLEKRKASFQGK